MLRRVPQLGLRAAVSSCRSFSAVASAQIYSPERAVDVKFQDGAAYRFHALWLRDACRDTPFLKKDAGERILATTPLVSGVSADLTATSTEISGTDLCVQWSDGQQGKFDHQFLRAYADRVAKPLEKAEYKPSVDVSWLIPYSGLPGQPGPKASDLNLFTNGPNFKIPEFTHEKCMTSEGNLDMIKSLLVDGVVKVTSVPNPSEEALHHFCNVCFAGLQKDPSRAEANWMIVKKTEASSISYDPDMRLNNHTDQSLPNHGIPGIALVVHYAEGKGANTIVDTFAVSEALRKSDPDAFEILTKYGNAQERDLIASRSDAAQNHTQSLWLASNQPIIQVDKDGNIIRCQYNEVFRVASTVPYDDFHRWYQAYLKWARMCHSEEFECNIPLKAGEISIFMNWRVMHGRAGNRDGSASKIQSADRMLVGGTITRENLFSTARMLIQRVHGVELFGPQLLM
eukprot:TRINITY_DN2885_c3_g1_i1.p1 TRINITY_DN2885_c3_g1~~TRINITY_DN2885_c3_g1_i1.p1  ORF type:complete len:456 (-),score=73.45 TRINITY_DN2885_c3_g1_i1:267-1634(-)